MSAAVILAVMALVGAGTLLVTDRSLTRVVLGLALLGHATVLGLLFAGGSAGEPPLADQAEPAEMSDPLPQAFSLTAIVIAFGLTLFVLALARRLRAQTGSDLVPDRDDGQGEEREATAP